METKYPHQMPIYSHVYTHDQRVWSQLLTCNSKECGRSNKLKTLKVAKWRMIDEWWRLKAERWRLGGFDNRQTDKQTFVIVESLSQLKRSSFGCQTQVDYSHVSTTCIWYVHMDYMMKYTCGHMYTCEIHVFDMCVWQHPPPKKIFIYMYKKLCSVIWK